MAAHRYKYFYMLERGIMLRVLVFSLAAAASGISAAQMGGGMMSTSQYFPLVDGMRYEYVFASGSRTSATAVVHIGQQWAGVSNLASMHTTFVCRPAISCAQDATDFYQMDADGMRYFGGDGYTPAGQHFMMTLGSPEWLLKNPVAPGTMMPGGMGYQGAEMWQSTVVGMNSVMGAQNYVSTYAAEALESVTTPMGTFPNALHVREGRGSGYVRDVWYAPGIGMVRWMDNMEEALLASATQPSGPVPVVARAVEFYDAALDHYFMSANADEINALDTGHFSGWQRTGFSFNVVDPAATTGGATSPVCRFYGLPSAGLDSHFYSASPAECAEVMQRFPNAWILESNDVFQMYLPDFTSGACPPGSLPVYRTWNNRRDSNHRYTMDPNVQSMMMGAGYLAEGYGNPPVIMCSPQ